MTVYLRKDLKKPMWYFRLCIQGRRYNRPVPEANSQRDAEKAEAIFKSELLRGKYDLADRKGEMLFKNLVEEYRAYAKASKKSWKTEQCLVDRLAEYFGNKRLREITPIFIEKYRIERKQTPKQRQRKHAEGQPPTSPKLIANATVNREVSILRKMFSIAVENGWFDNNPCISKRVRPLREDSHRERFLEPHEEQRMLKECIGPFAYFKAILICALHTGMRKGEILNLEWSHVDLKAGYITATKTKTGKDRNIPLTPTLMTELSQLQAAAKSPYVFTNPETGDRYGDVKRVFETITTNVKVAGLRFHDLRHTAATRMVAAGIDLIVVQEILGHESITTTMRYSHPVPERKLQAVMALEKYVLENTKLTALSS